MFALYNFCQGNPIAADSSLETLIDAVLYGQPTIPKLVPKLPPNQEQITLTNDAKVKSDIVMAMTRRYTLPQHNSACTASLYWCTGALGVTLGQI